MFKPAWERYKFSENLPAYEFCTARVEKPITYKPITRTSKNAGIKREDFTHVATKQLIIYSTAENVK